MAADTEHGVCEKSVYAEFSKHNKSTDLYIQNDYNYANKEGSKKYSKNKTKQNGCVMRLWWAFPFPLYSFISVEI